MSDPDLEQDPADQHDDHQADQHGHRGQPAATASGRCAPSWRPSRGWSRGGKPVSIPAHLGQDLEEARRIRAVFGSLAIDGQRGEPAPALLLESELDRAAASDLVALTRAPVSP